MRMKQKRNPRSWKFRRGNLIFFCSTNVLNWALSLCIVISFLVWAYILNKIVDVEHYHNWLRENVNACKIWKTACWKYSTTYTIVSIRSWLYRRAAIRDKKSRFGYRTICTVCLLCAPYILHKRTENYQIDEEKWSVRCRWSCVDEINMVKWFRKKIHCA